MAKFFINSLVVVIALIGIKCHAHDPHESVSRRTPAGIPYYLKSDQFHETFYSTTGLIILEIATNSPNTTEELTPNITLNSKQQSISLHGKVASSILQNCKLGEIFKGFYLNHEEKLYFFQQLRSSCFRGKLFQKKLELPSLDQYEKEIFWEQILSDCKSNNVPVSLVPPVLLQEILDGFQEAVLENVDLQLSIPLLDISAYFKLSLASCTFSVDSFIVAIQIPLYSNQDETLNYQDYSLIPIPLWMPDEPSMVCHLQDRASSTDLESVYHYNTNTGEITPEDKLLCHILHENICFMPDRILTKRSMLRSCVQAIIQSEDEDVLCDFKCDSFEAYNLPVIRKVTSDRYLVVADLSKNEEISVECPPFQKEETLVFPATGALEVVLPCDCHIRYGRHTFNSTVPCGAEFSKILMDFPGLFEVRDESAEQLV